jgi:ATP-dependent exoDNAse (exonuclease V) beta subunit
MPVRVHEQGEDSQGEFLEQRKVLLSEGKKSLTQIIKESLNFKYAYAVDTTLPVKSSVTSINSRQNQKDTAPELFEKRQVKHVDVLKQEENTKIGTAYHHFLEVCDFNAKNADNQLIDLLNCEKLSQDEIELLDANLLNRILALPLWDRLKEYKLYKEQPFITEFSARELYGEDSDAQILVQGIIDLLAVKENSAIIIDYKLSSKNEDSLAKDYQTQLKLYKMAVEKGLKLKVENTYILSLKTGQLIEVN